MSNEVYKFGITKDNPEYVMVKLDDYNKLIHQNEKIDEILELLKTSITISNINRESIIRVIRTSK